MIIITIVTITAVITQYCYNIISYIIYINCNIITFDVLTFESTISMSKSICDSDAHGSDSTCNIIGQQTIERNIAALDIIKDSEDVSRKKKSRTNYAEVIEQQGKVEEILNLNIGKTLGILYNNI